MLIKKLFQDGEYMKVSKKLPNNNFIIKNVIEKPSIYKAPSNKAVIGRYILPKTNI